MKLDDLQKLVDAATPAPWEAEPSSDNGTNTIWYSEVNSGVSVADACNDRDAQLIAAARTYLPRLIAVAREAHLMAGDGVDDYGLYTVESRFQSAVKSALAALET